MTPNSKMTESLPCSVQHKVANIWPDEDPIFWFLRGRAGDSCGWFRRCGGNGASELREYREHFRWQGTHRNRALVQHSSAREPCLAMNRLLLWGLQITTVNRQEGSKYGKQNLKD